MKDILLLSTRKPDFILVLQVLSYFFRVKIRLILKGPVIAYPFPLFA